MTFQALPFLEMDKQVWTQDIYLSVILFLQENNDQENENNAGQHLLCKNYAQGLFQVLYVDYL